MEDDQYDFEACARSFVGHIENCVKASLAPVNDTLFEPAERSDLEWSLSKLRPSFDELSKWFIEPLREGTPSRCMYGYEQLWLLIASAFFAGSSGTVTKSSKKYHAPEIIKETEDAIKEIHRSSGERGGKESGRVRREDAEKKWIAHATELIIDCRRTNAGFSQDDVAADVAAGWKKTEIEVPGHKSLKTLISKLEKSKVIQKMKRVGKRRVFK